MAKQPDTATGTLVRYVPAGTARDELLGLVRIGIKFAQQQHAGGSPGFLRRYITGVVATMESPTFEGLLEKLELAAVQRNQAADGKALPPIENVNRVWEVVTYHDPRRGEIKATFGHLRNILTKAKKANSPAPAISECG